MFFILITLTFDREVFCSILYLAFNLLTYLLPESVVQLVN